MDKILKNMLFLLISIIVFFCIAINIDLILNLLLSTEKSVLYIYVIGFLWVIFLPITFFSISFIFDFIVNFNTERSIIRFGALLVIYFFFSLPVFIAVSVNAWQFGLLEDTPQNFSFLFLITFLTLITIRFSCYPDPDLQINRIIELRIREFYFSFIMANVIIALFIICYYLYIAPEIIENLTKFTFSTIYSNNKDFSKLFFLYAASILLVSIFAEYILIHIRPHLKLISNIFWIIMYFVVIIILGFAFIL